MKLTKVLVYNHIVSGRHPWALTAQAPEVKGGWLHGEGA